MNNVVSIGVDLNLIDQDFAKDLEKLTNSIKDINIGADTSDAEKAIKDLGKTVGNIGVKPIAIKVDTSQFNRELQDTIKEVSQFAPEISVGFDNKSFVSLSDGLKSLQTHYISLQDYFSSNPLTIKGKVQVDDSEVRKRLEATLNSTITIKTSGGTSENILKDFENNLPKAIEKGFRAANTKGLGSLLLGGIGGIGKLIFSTVLGGIGLIGSGIVGLITLPFKSAFQGISTIATGSLLKLGEDLSSDVSSGLKTAINSALSSVVGDSSLFGEAIGTVLSTVIGEKLGGTVNSISKQVKALITEILGTEKVAVASAVQRSKQGVPKADKNTATEQAQKEYTAAKEGQLPQRAKQLRSDISGLASELLTEKDFQKEYTSEKSRLEKAAKELNIRLSPQQIIERRVKQYNEQIKSYEKLQQQLEASGDTGKASEVSKLIEQVKAPDTDVSKISKQDISFESARATAEAQVGFVSMGLSKYSARKKEIEKKQAILNTKVAELNSIEATLDSIASDMSVLGGSTKPDKQTLPTIYRQLVNEVAALSGIEVPADKIPTLLSDDTGRLQELNAGGAYHSQTNEIRIRPDLLEKLQSGNILDISDRDISNLIHELRHAIQFAFGDLDLYAGDTAPIKLLKPTAAEASSPIGAGIISSSDIKETEQEKRVSRGIEADAYVFQHRKAPEITEKLKKQELENQFYSKFGVGGLTVTNPFTAVVKETTARFKAVAPSLQENGIDTSTYLNEIVTGIQEAQKQFEILKVSLKTIDFESLNSEELSEFITRTELGLQSISSELRKLPEDAEMLADELTRAFASIDEMPDGLSGNTKVTPLKNEAKLVAEQQLKIQGTNVSKRLNETIKNTAREIYQIQETFKKISGIDLEANANTAIEEIHKHNTTLKDLYYRIQQSENLTLDEITQLSNEIQIAMSSAVQGIESVPKKLQAEAIRITKQGKQKIDVWDLSPQEYTDSLKAEPVKVKTIQSPQAIASEQIQGVPEKLDFEDTLESLKAGVSQMMDTVEKEALQPLNDPKGLYNKDLITTITRLVAQISKVNVRPDQVPTVVPMSKDIEALGARGAYEDATNSIHVASEALEEIASGNVSEELLNTLIHEIRHAVQAAFGDRRTFEAANDPTFPIIKPNTLEEDKYAPKVLGSVEGSLGASIESIPHSVADPQWKIEEDAYTFADRNEARIAQAVKNTEIENIRKVESPTNVGNFNQALAKLRLKPALVDNASEQKQKDLEKLAKTYGLSPQEQKALRVYISGPYNLINSYLRDGKQGLVTALAKIEESGAKEGLSKEEAHSLFGGNFDIGIDDLEIYIADISTYINEVLQKLPDFNGVLFRGERDVAGRLENVQKAGMETAAAFTSSGLAGGFPGANQIVIKSKKGKLIQTDAVDDFGAKGEVLHAPGTQYKLVGTQSVESDLQVPEVFNASEVAKIQQTLTPERLRELGATTIIYLEEIGDTLDSVSNSLEQSISGFRVNKDEAVPEFTNIEDKFRQAEKAKFEQLQESLDSWETPAISLPNLADISKKKPTFDVAPLPTNDQYAQQLQARATLIGSNFKQYTEQNFNPRLREFQETGDVVGINNQIKDFSTQAARAKKELLEIRQLLIESGAIEKNSSNDTTANAKKQVTLATKAAQQALSGKEAQRIAKSAANPDAVLGATKGINLVEETKKKLVELEKQGVKVGQDFSAGFVQGFEQSQGEVLQSVANEFNQVLETVDITLDRNSPSEEMRKRGLDFGKGFEIGAVASLAIANKKIADLILTTITASKSATEGQRAYAAKYAANVDAQNRRIATQFREGKYKDSNADEAVQELAYGTKEGLVIGLHNGVPKAEVTKILQQSKREANAISIPGIDPVELAKLNAELARQKKKQYLEQQRANLNIENKERVKSQAELDAIAAAEQARFIRYAKSNRTPAQVVAERQALEARLNAEVNTPDRQLSNLRSSQASKSTKMLLNIIKSQRQQQRELNQKLTELANQNILDPSIGADVALESVTRERDRRQATLKNIRQNPISYVANRVQGATVQKARYLTENAESLANMVVAKVGANPGLEDAGKIVRLQSAFGDLADKAAKFGENKSKDNFKQMNAAVVELENSLRELGVPFELINQQIDTFIAETKKLQAEGKIELDVDVEALAPEKFSFIDNILAKFSGLELGGLKAIAGLAKGFIAFQAGMLLQNFFSSIAQESFKAFVALDKLKTVLEFSSGSNIASNSNLKFITQQVKDLKIPLQSTVQGFTQLLAASRGTSLVNKDVRDISTGIGQASTVLSLSAEETQGSILALSQMLSKGRVQAEELRGQLGERIPGAMGIAARSMGVTEAALGKLMQTGNLASDNFVPKFGRQLQAEFGDASKYAAGNAQSAIFGVQNAYLQLQQSLGEGSATVAVPGLNILSATLQFLAENAETLRNVFSALAVTLTFTVGKSLLQVISYLISTNVAAGTAAGGIKAFLTMLNTSSTVMWTVGIFAALEVFNRLNGAINTELVQSFDKATEAAKRTKLAISDAFKPPEAKGKDFKPESTNGFGKFMDDYGLAFGEDLIKRSTFGIFKPNLTKYGYGQLENDTNTIAAREQLSIYADALQEAQGKLRDLKAGKGEFKNLAPVTKRLQVAEQERDALKAEIQKQYTDKGLQTPAASVLALDAKTQEINKLSEQRQKAAQAFTTTLAQSDLTIKALRSQIENLGSDAMTKNFSPEQLAEQEKELKASLKSWLAYKTTLEKTIGDMRLDPIITLLNKLREINLELTKTAEIEQLTNSLSKRVVAYQQNQGFNTNKFGDKQASAQNAEIDLATNKTKYNALVSAVAQDNSLLNSADIKRTLATFGISKDTSNAEIDDLIQNGNLDNGTKDSLEKIKGIIERRQQLADAYIGLNQAELAVKQAKQDYYLSKLDTNLNELKAKAQLSETENNNELKREFFDLKISQQARDLLTEQNNLKKIKSDLSSNLTARQEINALIAANLISAAEASNRLITLNQEKATLDGLLIEARQKSREGEDQYNSDVNIKNAEYSLSELKSKKFAGKLNLADFNKQNFAGNLELNDAKLAGLDIKKKTAVGSTALAAIKAEEAIINEERQAAQSQYATDELDRLTKEQEKAKNILELASLDRQKILQEQINKGILLQEDAQVEQLKLDREKLKEDLRTEEERTKLLERTRYKDPIKQQQNELAIQQSKIKTSEIILRLLQNEKSAAEAQYTSIKAAYNRIGQAINNKVAVAEIGLQKELKANDLLTKQLERQNNLISAQKGLRSALITYKNSINEIDKEGKDDRTKAQIDANFANEKLQSVRKTVELDREALTIEERRNSLTLNRLVLENQIAVLKNKGQQAKTGLEYLALQKKSQMPGGGGVTPEQLALAKNEYDIAKAEGEGLSDIGLDLEKSRQDAGIISKMKKRTQALEGATQINDAKMSAARAEEAAGNPKPMKELKKRKAYQAGFESVKEYEKSKESAFKLRSGSRGLTPYEINLGRRYENSLRVESLIPDTDDKLPNKSGSNSLSDQQYNDLSNSVGSKGIEGLADYSKINEQNYNRIKTPIKPELSQQNNEAQLLNSGIEKMVQLIDQKLNQPTSVRVETPITNYYNGTADGKKIGNDTTATIRKELYQLLQKVQEK